MGSVLAPFLNIGFNLEILHSGKVDSFTDKFVIFPKGNIISDFKIILISFWPILV